ncbi:MAG: MBL fold metallo-hydrolase [Acidobacteriota bacterium]
MRIRRTAARSALLLLSGLAVACLPPWGAALAEEDRGGVKVTFLANEGVLLEADGEAVMIDGFVTEPYSEYGALPDETAAALAGTQAGDGRFDSVVLALVSHVHRDHFQPEPAAIFLRGHPDAQLVSSPQVLAALAGDGEFANARSLLPKPGETEKLRQGKIEVEILRLRHGGRAWGEIENLGHLIHLGGQTILHIGDADTAAGNFAAYDLASREIDLALIPYWFFWPEGGRQTVKNHLVGRYTAAVHIPPKDFDEIAKALAKSHPNVRVPKVLESFELE